MVVMATTMTVVHDDDGESAFGFLPPVAVLQSRGVVCRRRRRRRRRRRDVPLCCCWVW